MKLWILFGCIVLLILIINAYFGHQVPFTSSLIKLIFESNFTTAVAGAGLGAYAAFSLSQNISQRKELLDDIRNTNIAIVLAAGVMVNAINLKKNVFLPQYKSFHAARRFYKKPWVFKKCWLDLRVMPTPKMEIDNLKKLTSEKVLLDDYKTIANVISMSESYHFLLDNIQSRQNFIQSHHSNRDNLPQADLEKRLYGLTYSNQLTDTTLEDVTKGMLQHANDIIYLSYQIYLGLREHGIKQVNQYKKNNGHVIHTLVKSKHIDQALNQGLIPKGVSKDLLRYDLIDGGECTN